MRVEPTDRDQFMGELVRQMPEISAYKALCFGAELIRLAKRNQSLAVALCNGDLTPRQQTMRENNARRIRDLCAHYGVKVAQIGGDPRGLTVKIHLPNGRGNTFGGDSAGWGVPV